MFSALGLPFTHSTAEMLWMSACMFKWLGIAQLVKLLDTGWTTQLLLILPTGRVFSPRQDSQTGPAANPDSYLIETRVFNDLL